MKVDDYKHNRNKSTLSVGALFNATNANGLSDEEDIDEFTKSFDDKLEEQQMEENSHKTQTVSLSIDLHSKQNEIYQRPSDTYSKCINEQEDIEIDSWETNKSYFNNETEIFTPQGIDDSQDPLFAETFSPVSTTKERQASIPSVSGYWDEEKTEFDDQNLRIFGLKNGIYL